MTRASRFLARVARLLGSGPGKAARDAGAPGDGTIRTPLHCDWAWRPDLWREPLPRPEIACPESGTPVGAGARLFFDGEAGDIHVRQIRDDRGMDDPAFALCLELDRCGGSYASLALDLPAASAEGLGSRHVIGLALAVEAERPARLFGRLNIRHGPNTEQLLREFPMDASEMTVEFDLGYSGLRAARVGKIWLDLIVEKPGSNILLLRDLTMTRRPRLEI